MVWVYKNHERAEIIGPILLIPAPDPLNVSEVDYFPNGMQPKVPSAKWISHRLY